MSVFAMNDHAARGCVYFAQPTNGGPVKVGTTGDIRTRTIALAAWIPAGVEIITSMPGGVYREAYLKIALKSFCLQGEWMRSCVEVWRVIDEVVQTGSLSWLPPLHQKPAHDETFNAIIADFGSIAKLAQFIKRSHQFRTPHYCVTSDLLAAFWLIRSLAHRTFPKWLHDRHTNWFDTAKTWPKSGAVDALLRRTYSKAIPTEPLPSAEALSA